MSAWGAIAAFVGIFTRIFQGFRTAVKGLGRIRQGVFHNTAVRKFFAGIMRLLVNGIAAGGELWRSVARRFRSFVLPSQARRSTSPFLRFPALAGWVFRAQGEAERLRRGVSFSGESRLDQAAFFMLLGLGLFTVLLFCGCGSLGSAKATAEDALKNVDREYLITYDQATGVAGGKIRWSSASVPGQGRRSVGAEIDYKQTVEAMDF